MHGYVASLCSALRGCHPTRSGRRQSLRRPRVREPIRLPPLPALHLLPRPSRPPRTQAPATKRGSSRLGFALGHARPPGIDPWRSGGRRTRRAHPK
eukprot:scaffold25803_cov129-Isochrysis_galbana.AAC.4